MRRFSKKSTGIVCTIFGASVLLLFSSFVPNHRGPKLASLGVMKVVIDAGHGGHDPGNLGTGRYKDTEKDIALEVAIQVGDYIQRAYPDVDVIYTRKTDKFVTLKDRTTIANQSQADLFISIHCNSAANKDAHGTETFVMGLNKLEANLKTAQKENSVILLEENYEQVYEGFNPDSPESLIERVIAQSAYLEQSLSLSAKIQDQYRERVSRRDRGVKQAPYWVISFTTMPSILTELGFLTHKGEEDFLNSENGKAYMSSAIYRAFKEYKAEIEGVELTISEVDKSLPELKTTPKKKEKKTVADLPVVFKIQLMASSTQIPLEASNFNGLEGVKEYEVDGLYKYTIGEVTDYKKAVSLQRTVREKAFPKAFIIAFQDDNRIPISEAMEISKKRANGHIN